MAKGLTRDAMVDAALAVLDETGIEGLTVRAVAERLGVKAPALYWHVRDKQALVDEMGTRVWSGIAAEAAAVPRTDWREVCAGYAWAARRGLLAHRDGARVFSGTYLTDAEVLRRQEPLLAWLGEQGFTAEAATDAFAILTAFVVGHCIEEQARRQAGHDGYTLAHREERVDADEHPLVTASGRRMFAEDGETRFDALLQAVLDGVAGLRSERR
ncbi:TetR family transcriptional regulator [Streptomyces sp. 3MP-14]|uniref:TetR family transcriptional regulator n=1 Tax=Streptomyces mimosae TaxID=2586635 RepID=A0A5N5ZY78_9ACTN|nr:MULTISPECIES: TetR/AcrR family transcriptional regulator C-terminal domain-containing protein [Streptomyces]KAB8160320.1 TetR family transcriptional regulator [Streptomyces mimosae]KAB8172918.1 TetR family transcriptional regulator [Streptomyces sp. 3MP-14]